MGAERITWCDLVEVEEKTWLQELQLKRTRPSCPYTIGYVEKLFYMLAHWFDFI